MITKDKLQAPKHKLEHELNLLDLPLGFLSAKGARDKKRDQLAENLPMLIDQSEIIRALRLLSSASIL